MNLINYWLLVIAGGIVVGLLPQAFPGTNPDEVRWLGFVVCMLLYIPTIAILRMRYLKMSWKEFLIGIIPFYGTQHRFRRLLEK
ncbi:hypothetical protein [Persicitalea jodogahamensis]|uniref:hypothetical protein n=1 Tax=Persicitalea jodogahamensis TaxID=402147 RepID=UPI0016799B32|nr:hypothetical protein [Persicitalea jodogahamensis]